MRLQKIITALIVFFMLPTLAFSQATTSSITGIVTGADGKPLDGASIVAVHEPSGTKYRTIAQADGMYTIPGMRVGGPYTLTVEFTGFATKKIENLTLGLGTPLSINVSMEESGNNLSDVNVSAAQKGTIISSLHNGPAMTITSNQIQALPTINSSVQDFVRFTPQVKVGNNGANGQATGMSFAGQSNRYNKFTIDGANASDVFGLGSTGTNGGQANVNPISMEAIQEFQIIMAPYDVTMGGFTGGGINAVTKSGTNEFHGAAYIDYQNQRFVGMSAPYDSSVTRSNYPTFKNERFGAALGGPIIKNKLFFYANVERYVNSTPLAYDPTQPGSGSKVNPDTLAYIRQQLQNEYGYDPGSYGAINNTNTSTSVFARVDWNINDKNKLMVRFNHVNGYESILSRSATSATFSNSGYGFKDQNNSFVAELNSSFSSRASNLLRVTYTAVRDARTVSQFPSVLIYDYNPASAAAVTYNIGADFSSVVNGLNQNVYTLTDNLNFYRGRHTITVGTDNTLYYTTNYYLQYYYGYYTYGASGSTADAGNINNFLNNTGLTTYNIGFATNPDGTPAAGKAPASLHTAQFSVYAQDNWSITNHFKLTYGLRIDAPVFFNKPADNAQFATTFPGYATNQMPKFEPLFSPRVGFNWDVKGNAATQLRGGAGLFSGTLPFVWISNQISNTGVLSQSVQYNSALIAQNGIQFQYNPKAAQMGAFVPQNPSAAVGSVINVIDKNFKFPQVFRANLAVDQKLNVWGLIGTLEGVYTKTLNNAYYQNINLAPDGTGTVNIAGTQRPYWGAYANSAFGNVLDLGNTSKGYSYNFTAQIQKPYSRGWTGSIAYTYGRAMSLNDLPSSVAQSNWRGTVSVNGLNNPALSVSNFNMGSRVVGFISKEIKEGGNNSVTFTLTYTGESGQRMSYVYGNNISGDYSVGSTSGYTALAYIPKNESEANFVDIVNSTTGAVTTTAAQQWTQFQTFMHNNKYLEKHAGQNAQRNGSTLPWENHWDFRVAEDIFITKGTKLELFVDILNIGNLLDKNWGWSYGNSDGFYPQTSSLFGVVTSGTHTINGAPVANAATASNPYFQFNQNNFTKIKGVYRPYAISDFTSRWNCMVGARFSF